MNFQSHGYVVTVLLMQGVSEIETFSKPDNSHFSDKEVEQLLKSEGGTWTSALNVYSKVARDLIWTRGDGATGHIEANSLHRMSKKVNRLLRP